MVRYDAKDRLFSDAKAVEMMTLQTEIAKPIVCPALFSTLP